MRYLNLFLILLLSTQTIHCQTVFNTSGSLAFRSDYAKYQFDLHLISNGIEYGIGHFGFEENSEDFFHSANQLPVQHWNLNYAKMGIQFSDIEKLRVTVIGGLGGIRGTARGDFLRTSRTGVGTIYGGRSVDEYEKIKFSELGYLFQLRLIPLRYRAAGLGVSYFIIKSKNAEQHSLLFTIPFGARSTIPKFLSPTSK